MRSINLTSESNTRFFHIPNMYDYFELMKPRVMSLVVFTTISGMYLAPSQIHPVLSFFSILLDLIKPSNASS